MTIGSARVTLDLGDVARAFQQLGASAQQAAAAIAKMSEPLQQLGQLSQTRERERRIGQQLAVILKSPPPEPEPQRPRRAISFDGRF